MTDIIPVNASVHYKCAFDVSSQSIEQIMTHLRQTFRSWCIERIGGNDQTLHRSWFYIGNHRTEPQYVLKGFQIRTVMAPSDDPVEPSSWAMEMIHPDDEERSRRWSVEITLRKNVDGTVRFATINKHWMIPYFIGEYPDPPFPSAPRYVRRLLSDDALVCKRGDAAMKGNWHTVSNDDARTVFDSLVSPDRLAPAIFLAADSETNRALIAPARIMSAVVGNANVYYLPSDSVIDEMNYYLGDDLRCESGMIRVFVPGVQHGDSYNARLHRFLTKHIIAQRGEDEIMRFLTNGLSRNGMTFRLNELTSFRHIFTERRKHAIKTLADQKESAKEENQFVWEDNQQLTEQASEWESLAIQFEAENKRLKEQNSSLRCRVDETDRVRGRIADLESQVSGISALTDLPTTLSTVLSTVQTLFPKRIEVLTSAVASAEEYSKEHGGHWGKKEQVRTAWAMVFDIATSLYELLFVDRTSDFEDRFNSISSFELAMSEGKQTNKDSRLMGLRKVMHKGKEYDITPHLKYGNRPPKLLRLYFAINNDDKTFLIGHFGDHLENYSTRKQ